MARRPFDMRARRLVDACNTLRPVVRAATSLLRRKRLAADELARVVPGLDAWPQRYGLDMRGIDLAILIGTGANAYDIVARVFRTRRTPEQLEALHRAWQMSQPRAAP